MTNRIDEKFAALKTENRSAFIVYITGGDPSLEKTTEIAATLERAGTDILEIGVPFSDPLADGIANQLGAQRALQAGATLPKLLYTDFPDPDPRHCPHRSLQLSQPNIPIRFSAVPRRCACRRSRRSFALGSAPGRSS